MSDSTLIRARNLTRRSKTGLLLDHLSLELGSGDRLALVGPTGSGKSLLLRTIAMLERIDSGELLWRDKPVQPRDATLFRSRVIYLPQQPPKFEGTVESVLRLPFSLRIHRQRCWDREWILQQLREVQRDASFLAQPHHQLSGGESQIAAILRAIALAPEVLLLDEPTSALDATSARHIESIVNRWYQQEPQARAFIWVSHDADQVDRVCRRRVEINHGRVERTGELA